MIAYAEMLDPVADEYVEVTLEVGRSDVEVVTVQDGDGNERPDMIAEAEKCLTAGQFERAIEAAIDDDYARHEPDPDRDWDDRAEVE